MKTAVLVFPGSNCDRDIATALEQVGGTAPTMVWHAETELPDALMRNAGLDFVCRDVALTVGTSQSVFTSRYAAGEQIVYPVAHHDGNYSADAETLDRLEGEGRVAFRYAGSVNGSARGIAGVLSPAGNVLGLMPHPERRIETAAHGGDDGRRMFEGLFEAVGA